ncbi:hypothetical protein C4K35_1925 [Pseudomonas chlororaphis subsp. piscium]|uniref:hypothetical protein n=1 Tax=Pseudomonas chlororaphis TaxID=587753 RepID=UPI000F581E92|nr:hypothetical protein [Pseudomonas chlororaphis]AZC49518.1 hypothetical protein C4K35_1925 [Pseudomonas chlororaphis subsp. piscium]
MTSKLVLRYAPGKKLFSVQRHFSSGSRLVLVQIPAEDRKDFVTIAGQHYAITPQMYALAAAFRPVTLDLPVSSVKKAASKVGKVFSKIKGWLGGTALGASA